jgi:hypothetical protein
MVEVLERGDIQFFFRPTVQPADPDAAASLGVQSFFVVLSTRDKHRRVRIGRKRMPATTGERLWARVERIGSFSRAMGDLLEDEHYHTKTRGERYQPAARPIAHGCYALVQHDDHVHFAYRVDHRESAPEEVDVPDAASHVVLFERVPRGRATWTTEGTPARLDEEGAEIVLVGVDDDPERELGVELLQA